MFLDSSQADVTETIRNDSEEAFRDGQENDFKANLGLSRGLKNVSDNDNVRKTILHRKVPRIDDSETDKDVTFVIAVGDGLQEGNREETGLVGLTRLREVELL